MKETKAPKTFTPNRDVLNTVLCSTALSIGAFVAISYFTGPRVSNDELLDIIKNLARQEGYSVQHRPEQVMPEGWEVEKHRGAIAGCGIR